MIKQVFLIAFLLTVSSVFGRNSVLTLTISTSTSEELEVVYMYIQFNDEMDSSQIMRKLDEFDHERDGIVHCYSDVVKCSPDPHLDGFVPIFLNPIKFNLSELEVHSIKVEKLVNPDIVTLSDHTLGDKEWLERPPATSRVVRLQLMEYIICFQDDDANSRTLLATIDSLDPNDEDDEGELQVLFDKLMTTASSNKVIVLAEAFF